MSKQPIKFPNNLNLSSYEKKIYNGNLKNFLKDKPKNFIKFYHKAKNLSMLSKERLYNIFNCLNYIKLNGVKGDIVEVGCFKGANLALCRKFSKKKSMDLILLWVIKNLTIKKRIFGETIN